MFNILFFKNEGRIMAFLGKSWLRELIASRTVLDEILKKVLQTERIIPTVNSNQEEEIKSTGNGSYGINIEEYMTIFST